MSTQRFVSRRGQGCSLTQDHHSLTVSNNQVYSNNEFDLWPVYSGERFRASWPSCLLFWLEKGTYTRIIQEDLQMTEYRAIDNYE